MKTTTHTGLALLVWLAMVVAPTGCGSTLGGPGGAAGNVGGGGTGTLTGTGGSGVGGQLDGGAAGQLTGGSGSSGTGTGAVVGGAGAPGGRGGGIGGRAGGSGSGGSVGVGGSGGSLLRCDYSWPVGCTTNANVVCGNGTRDTCMGPAGLGPDCPLATFGELCDGNDVGGATCQQQGFGSGTLTCLPNCNGLDVSRCSECAAGPSVRGCGPVPMSAQPLSVAIDASDNQIGVAWVEQVEYGRSPKLWFARLAPDLTPINVSEVPDTAVANEIYATNLYSVPLAIAPLPSGWVIAGHASTHPDLFLHVFDGAGNHVSRIVLDSDGTTYAPQLASRPNGGPLLVWANADGIRAAVVSNDGLTTTTPIDLHVAGGQEFASASSVAFAGDTFYVLLTVQTSGDDVWMRWARVSTSGALLGFVEPPKGMNFINPYLVPGGNDLRVVFETWTTNSNDPVSVVVRPFNPMTGVPLSPPRAAATYQQGYFYGTGVAFGDDTFFALGGPAGSPFGAARLAPNGSVVTPIYPVAVGREAVDWFTAVRRGPDAIVVWTGRPQGPIKIARLVP